MTTTEAEVTTSAKAGPTRGQKLWRAMMDRRLDAQLSLHRARLLTESYRETEGQPAFIRRAKALANIVKGMPLYLLEGDLLAGAFAAEPMAPECYPEFDSVWMLDELDTTLVNIVPAKDREEFREICEYWRDRCVKSNFLSNYDEAEKKRLDDIGELGSWVYYRVRVESDIGYFSVNYEKAIKLGLRAVMTEVDQELQRTSPTDDESFAKVNLLKAMRIVLEAGIEYGKRNAALARELAEKAEGQRQKELLKLAEICEWVPENPARSFHEAVQTLCFVHMLIFLESGSQVSPGRSDQYLYPYYKRDIEQSKITREEAVEILECMRPKFSAFRRFRSGITMEVVSGDAQFHNITIGGQTPDGRDATNEVSYLFLEAASRTRTPHPTLSIRWSEKSPEDFILKGLELVRMGIGYPAFFNDGPSIEYLTQQGIPVETARDYCVAGCVQHLLPTQSGPPDVAFLNFPKMLEFAMHDGIDPRNGRQLGPATGKFEDFRTFEEFLGAFEKQLQHFSEESGKIRIFQRLARVAVAPTIFSSCLVDDCIKRGKNVLADGPRFTYPAQTPVGIIDTVDSLAAVKKCVFDEGTVGKKELMDALAANFKGKEDVRKLLLSAPKYGNDDDHVDRIAADLYEWWQNMVCQIDGPYGAKHKPMPYSISSHGAAGKRVGALPSGRLSGISLADGSVSPCQGSDVTGPTAVLNSAGKINQLPLLGTLLNMKFHPSALATTDDLRKLGVLIRTYFEYGGKHIQFNVVDKKTLLDAQVHPEMHRDLIVRVAGYSAMFNDLQRGVQDEIIKRTEYAEL